jgi:hypothetical protein
MTGLLTSHRISYQCSHSYIRDEQCNMCTLTAGMCKKQQHEFHFSGVLCSYHNVQYTARHKTSVHCQVSLRIERWSVLQLTIEIKYLKIIAKLEKLLL